VEIYLFFCSFFLIFQLILLYWATKYLSDC